MDPLEHEGAHDGQDALSRAGVVGGRAMLAVQQVLMLERPALVDIQVRLVRRVVGKQRPEDGDLAGGAR